MHLNDSSHVGTENGVDSNGNDVDMTHEFLAQNSSHQRPVRRSRPTVHTPVDPPVCHRCRSSDLESLFDAKCEGCRQVLSDPGTTAGEMFAILRQWTPQTQHSLELVIRQVQFRNQNLSYRMLFMDAEESQCCVKMLKKGTHVDDRDGLTDMTMLHYVCKAGTRGIGDIDQSCRMIHLLLSNCADPYLRCRWTNMAAIHYATYFDVAPVLVILLGATKAVDVDSPCSEFDHGSPLHIAARNLSLDSAVCLLEHGADPHSRDMNGKIPIDFLPALDSFDAGSEAGQQVAKFHKLLSEAETPSDELESMYSEPQDTETVAEVLQTLGVDLGDKVIVGGIKAGLLRYCGSTRFASGLWAGVELDEPVGKNNGSVAGVRYFRCPPNYGIFAPLSKINKPGILMHNRTSSASIGCGTGGLVGGSMRNLTPGKVPVEHVTAKVNTGLRASRQVAQEDDTSITVGDRVLVAGRRLGFVRYHGETHFSTGPWFGIELDKPVGKNDGSVNETRYFTCAQNHGVFAPPSRVQKLSADNNDSPAHLALTSSSAISDISSRSFSVSVENGMSPQHGSGGAGSTPRKVLARSKTIAPIFNASFNTSTPLSSLSTSRPLKLAIGMNVLCSGEIGTVKYIGAVDFADGLWVGIELRSAKGKHDGLVQGRRYFTCRQGHGLIVRPNKVTVRGINASQLLDE